jgi:hypothetical protein
MNDAPLVVNGSGPGVRVSLRAVATPAATAGWLLPQKRFGVSPKFSTPVENTVEKRRLIVELVRRMAISGHFPRGEARRRRFFGLRR